MPEIDQSFLMNHTCLRIKDPKESLPFYTDILGFKLIRSIEFPDFTLYMLGYPDAAYEGKNWSARPGVLELCHNHGVEKDPEYKLNNGNGTTFRGFGHICVSVDNIQQAEKELLAKGVQFKKKLSEGRQKYIAFILDPNGYWIELIQHEIGKKPETTNSLTYKFNHTMIRVKDPKKSLDFYRNVLGFKLLSTSEHPDAKFTLYFLGYNHDDKFVEDSMDTVPRAAYEGIIELTHNWGTESDDSFEGYHNGNTTDNGALQGYGHTCVSCKDPAKLCSQIEAEYPDANWSLKWNQGNIKEIAFIKDPDGYSIEILGHNLFSKL